MGHEYQDAGATGAILLLVQALKLKLPDKYKKWLPLVVLVLGAGYGVFVRPSGAIMPSIVAGIQAGFAAIGQQDGSKVTLRAK